MANDFKKCLNGHYYQGATCPYCKNSAPAASVKTEIYPDNGGGTSAPTDVYPGNNAPTSGTKTQIIDIIDEGATGYPMSPNSPQTPISSNHTVFGNEEETFSPTGKPVKTFREYRKMVGWLVSYTLDAMGVDFKLYEGRNIIGRDADCNITVNDNMVSGKHAVLLFRAGKYSITDSQSSHGTFVNDNDIDLEPCYLQDGDVIRMGKTTFKFRTSF